MGIFVRSFGQLKSKSWALWIWWALYYISVSFLAYHTIPLFYTSTHSLYLLLHPYLHFVCIAVGVGAG